MRPCVAFLLLCLTVTHLVAEPFVSAGVCQHCPPAPDLTRSPIRLFTQEQMPPSQAGALARSAPTFHPVNQPPPQCVSAPPPPSIRLISFNPPSVHVAPFSPPCVATFHVHTPPPHWGTAPPRPNVQIAHVVEHPSHYGSPFHRGNITIMHQASPQPPVFIPACLSQ